MLHSNKLTTLRKEVFNSISRSSLTLLIDNNPLKCDAKMCWIKQDQEKRTDTILP